MTRPDTPPADRRPRHERNGLTVLWRGSLASCNYGCPYCPFAKTKDSRAALAQDARALERFEAWATSRPYPVSILITPWGEALIRRAYRVAITRLSHAPNIPTIAIQTNLSCSVRWVESCDRRHAAFWTTYHPGETDRRGFVAKIQDLEAMGARYSVGVVGLKEHLDEIDALRQELPPDAYLWVNAYKRVENYYTDAEIERLTVIDPLFALNNRVYETRGSACRTGETVISVRADGSARRCHFTETPLGDIFEPDFERRLTPRPCAESRCRCHIGYSHLDALALDAAFGDGFLERRAAAPHRSVAEAALRRLAQDG